MKEPKIGDSRGFFTVEHIVKYGKGFLIDCRCKCGSFGRYRYSDIFGSFVKRNCCGLNGCSAKIKHGAARRLNNSMYSTWCNIMYRCYDEENCSYHNYGGRGIKVSKDWFDVNKFISDMGPRPSPYHTIDRINNDRNYSKDNCRWATRMQQSNNTRAVRKLTVKGVTKTISEWSASSGLTRKTISSRVEAGWTDENSVLTPKQKNQYK